MAADSEAVYFHRDTADFFRCQPVVVNWLALLAGKVKSAPSFFMSLEIYRYIISSFTVTREYYQLYAVASFGIAFKYHEMEPEDIFGADDLAKVCVQSYTEEQIIAAEGQILKALDWKLRSFDGSEHIANIEKLQEVAVIFTKSQISYMYCLALAGFQGDGGVGIMFTASSLMEVMTTMLSPRSLPENICKFEMEIDYVRKCMEDAKLRAPGHGGPRVLSGIKDRGAANCEVAIRGLIS